MVCLVFLLNLAFLPLGHVAKKDGERVGKDKLTHDQELVLLGLTSLPWTLALASRGLLGLRGGCTGPCWSLPLRKRPFRRNRALLPTLSCLHFMNSLWPRPPSWLTPWMGGPRTTTPSLRHRGTVPRAPWQDSTSEVNCPWDSRPALCASGTLRRYRADPRPHSAGGRTMASQHLITIPACLLMSGGTQLQPVQPANLSKSAGFKLCPSFSSSDIFS